MNPSRLHEFHCSPLCARIPWDRRRCAAAGAPAVKQQRHTCRTPSCAPSLPFPSWEAMHCAHMLGRRSWVRSLCAAASAAAGARPEGLLLPESVRLGPGLRLMAQRFQVAGRQLTAIAPADVDAALDMYAADGREGDPYWTRVWPSALALAQVLLERPHLVRGLSVADLGCGLGIAGVAAALAGAREVVMLDREPLALQCAMLSARACGLQQAILPPGTPAAALEAWRRKPRDVDGDAVGSAALPTRGGNPATSSGTSNGSTGSSSSSHSGSSSRPHGTASHDPNGTDAAPTVRSAVFDWHSPGGQGQAFDVVLACDVLYEPDAVEPIAAAVPRLLRPTRGRLLLADPPNRTAANRERFVELLAAAARRGGGGGGTFALDECSQRQCLVQQLDPDLIGSARSETIPVQLMVFRRTVGGDTVGVKPT